MYDNDVMDFCTITAITWVFFNVYEWTYFASFCKNIINFVIETFICGEMQTL